MLSNSSQKSVKKSKSAFKGLSRSKKHKKDESNDVNVQIQSNHDKSSKKKSPFQTISTDFLQTTNNIVSGVNHSVNNDSSMPMMTHVITTPTTTNSITYTAPESNSILSIKETKKRKMKKKQKDFEQFSVNVENNLPTNQQSEIIHHNNTIKGKKKRGLKLHSHKSMLGEEILKVVNKPIFGVSLDVAYNRNPSHDEVILPAFFRHCIDYIEQHGLSSEGIYRVPGVHSQVQAVISSIDNGQEFPDIPPTSAAFYHNEDIFTKLRSSHFLTGSDITTKGKTRHSTSSHSGTKEITSILLPKTQDNRGVIASPASFNFTSGGFYPRNSVIGAGSGVTVSTAVGSGHSPVKYPYSTSLLTTTTTTSSHSILPHDPAVIASVIKHFLRSLPEPILTKRLSNVIESLTTDTVQFYHNLSALIHQELPVSNRYLLAWIIQHMMHIIDRAGENRMTLANIIIVLSPCLGISHRLLSILLNPTPPENFTLDLCKLDPKLPLFNPNKSNIDPSTWHWLFPHPIYLLKPYIPPLKLTHGLELPDSTEELDIELKKQESLLSHLYEQIKAGETNPGKEYLLRDVQHIVTEIKRRKTLTDPEAIRQEIIKQQAQLDKLHLAIAQSTITDAHSDTSSGLSQSKDTSLPSSGQRRRITGSEKPSKSHQHHQRQLTDKKIPYSDELWEVQRQITMLKRKLKQHEKSNEQQQQQQQPSSTVINSEVNTTITTTTTTRTIATASPPLSSTTAYCQPPSVLYMSGAPLIIPSISELDQEEVLNLTLRKLPIEPILITTTTVTGDDELPCSKTLNSATYSDNTVVCSQTPTISSVNEETIKKEISSVTTTVVTTTTTTPLLVNDDESKLLKSPNELLTVNRDDGDDDKKDQDINASLKETVKITNTSTTSTGYSTDGIETHPDTISISDIHESQQDESTAKLNQIPTNHDQVIEEANDLNCIHPTKISLKTDNDLYNQNSKITTVYPSQTISSFTNSHYLMNNSPSLPPPSDLAPKLKEFTDFLTDDTTTITTTTNVVLQDPNQRKIMYYKARKQELIAIQADLRARIRSENAEISRLQSCINHLLESGGRRARRIYRTYITAKHLCPAWLCHQNPLITTPQHNVSNTEEEKLNWHISQPWTKIAESLTAGDDNDDDFKDTTQYSSIDKLRKKCLLDDEYSSGSDHHQQDDYRQHRHHYHQSRHSDADEDSENDSLEEPILMNRDSSPDSVAYSRLTEEEGEEDRVEGNNVYLHVLKNEEKSMNCEEGKQTSPQKENEAEYDEQEDDEEEEDEDECELELAATLHQLTLDNARLEQLNARSLEAIQAERNRCADLKVLLKLRHNTYIKPTGMIQTSTTDHLMRFEVSGSLNQHSNLNQSSSITA